MKINELRCEFRKENYDDCYKYVTCLKTGERCESNESCKEHIKYPTLDQIENTDNNKSINELLIIKQICDELIILERQQENFNKRMELSCKINSLANALYYGYVNKNTDIFIRNVERVQYHE